MMILLCGGQKLHSFINEAFLHCAQNNLCIKPCSVTTGVDGTVYVRLLFTVYMHLAYYKPVLSRLERMERYMSDYCLLCTCIWPIINQTFTEAYRSIRGRLSCYGEIQIIFVTVFCIIGIFKRLEMQI